MLTKTQKTLVNLFSFKFVPVKSEAGPSGRPKLQGFPHESWDAEFAVQISQRWSGNEPATTKLVSSNGVE
jgi:hypothetical protein